MFTAIFWLVVGLFIGWNIPRPEWAKNIQHWVIDSVVGLFQKK